MQLPRLRVLVTASGPRRIYTNGSAKGVDILADKELAGGSDDVSTKGEINGGRGTVRQPSAFEFPPVVS